MKEASARRRAARTVAAALGAAAFSLAAAAPPAARALTPRPQDRPNVANDLEKKDAGREAAKPAESPARPQPSGKGKRNTPRTAVPQPLEVNFKTDLPHVKFYRKGGGLSMQPLGETDGEGRLKTKLPPGRHDIIASRPGLPFKPHQIEVKPGQTDFTLNLAQPQPAPKQEGDEVAAAPEQPKEEPAAQASIDLAEVERRFLNAREGEGVSASDWQQAHEQARAAAGREPGNKYLAAQALFAEGQVAAARGDHVTALVSFNKATLASPDYVPAHVALGNAYLATNQPAEAFKAYNRAAQLNRELALAYKGMGDALSRQNRTREAAASYERAKSLGRPLPTNTDLATARDLKKRKQWRPAVEKFEEVARTEPSAELYIDIAECYDKLKQPLRVLEAYEKATKLDANSAVAFYKYGEVLYEARENEKAMDALERAIALDPTGAQIDRKKARKLVNEAAKRLGIKND